MGASGPSAADMPADGLLARLEVEHVEQRQVLVDGVVGAALRHLFEGLVDGANA